MCCVTLYAAYLRHDFIAGSGWLLSAMAASFAVLKESAALGLGLLGVAVRACFRVGPPSTTGHGLPGSLQARAASLRMRSVPCKSLARASRSEGVPPYPAYPIPARGRAANPLLWVLLYLCWQACLEPRGRTSCLTCMCLPAAACYPRVELPARQCCETYLHCLKWHCHYQVGAQVWVAWCLHGASADRFQTGKPCWSTVGSAPPVELLYLSPCTHRCVSRSFDEDVALRAQTSCGGTG